MTRITHVLAAGLIAAAGLAAPAGAQQSSTTISMSNGEVEGESIRIIDGTAYRIEFDGDGVHSAFIDDEEVEFKTDEGVVILEHEGETIEMPVPRLGSGIGADFGAGIGRDFDGFGLRGLGDNDNQFFTQNQLRNQPKTMVGLTQRPLDDQLREHLELEEGVGTMILSVIEGLPADEAGLREGDVLVSVNGREVEGARTLTEELADLEPGDELDVTVLRKGLPESLTITVAKFDAEKLYGGRGGLRELGGGEGRAFRWELNPDEFEFGFDFDELQDRIRGEIEDIEELDPAQLEEFERAMEEAREQVERAMERALRARELRFNPDWDADLLIRPDDEERAVIIEREREREAREGAVDRQRRQLEAEAAELRQRNRELESRLESLEAKLDRLLSHLESGENEKDSGEGGGD